MCADELIGDPFQPGEKRTYLAVDQEFVGDLLDQLGRVIEIASGECMIDRLVDLSIALVPGPGAPMQLRFTLGSEPKLPVAEKIGEEAVVAIPASLLIERNEEQVGALQIFKQCL